MYLKTPVRHAIVAVVLASSIATAVGAGGAAQADNDLPPDPSAATVPATTSPPPPEESSTTSPTPPESTESTAAPTPTDAPTTTSVTTTPSTTTPPAAIATTTTTPAAIATPTTVAPNNALASVVAFSVASAPLSPVAKPGNGSVTLTWKPPSSNGGATVTKYAVQRLVNGQWTNLAYPTGLSYTAGGLSNGTKYYFRIRAINAAGWSPASTTVSAVPRTVSSAPLSPTATPGNGSVTLTWKPPSSNGGATVTKYAVQRLVNGQWQNIAWPTTGTYTNIGLANGTKYYFRIRAYNAAGWSPVSTTVSAIPRTVPSAPLSLVAAPGNHAVILDWTAPSSNGGAAVTGYIVEWAASGGGPWAFFGSTTNTYYTASSAYFNNGTPYYFRIRAANAAGYSAPSSVVSATPRTKPSSPAPCNAVQSIPGSLWMTVTWNAPLNNGGAPIQEYTVEFFENGHYLFSDYVVPTANSFYYGSWKMPYYFNDFEVRVHARNAAGYSPACVVDSIDILP